MNAGWMWSRERERCVGHYRCWIRVESVWNDNPTRVMLEMVVYFSVAAHHQNLVGIQYSRGRLPQSVKSLEVMLSAPGHQLSNGYCRQCNSVERNHIVCLKRAIH